MKAPKVAVVIHAQFLPPGVWLLVMWGDPSKGIYGVIPMALLIAARLNAAVVYICNGIPSAEGNRVNSPDALSFAISHASELPFEAAEMLNKAVDDEHAQNTNQEVSWVSMKVIDDNITEIHAVTAPKHTMRALQEFLIAKEEGRIEKSVSVSMTASMVDFPHTAASMVSIAEVSHRFDIPRWNTWRYCKSMFQIMRSGGPKFGEFLQELGDLMSKYGVKVDWAPLDSK